MFRFLRVGSLAAAIVFASSSSAFAAVFAQYLNGTYTQGTFTDSNDLLFNNPQVVGPVLDQPDSQTVAGNPAGLTGLDGFTPFPFQSIISPFSPPYDLDQDVTVGAGGSITVRFPQPVNVSSGLSVGVFTGAGFADTDGFGDTDSSGDNYTSYTAAVQVSDDNIHWSNPTVVNFTIPINYYLNASTPYDMSAPANPQIGDFGEPFTGNNLSFASEDSSQVEQTFGTTAGGTWLDLSGMGLGQIQFVQFTEPACVVPDGSFLSLVAVTANDADLPEPCGALGLLLLGALLLLCRPARRSAAAILPAAAGLAVANSTNASPVSTIQFQDGNVLNVQGIFGAGTNTAYLAIDFNNVAQNFAWQFNWNPATNLNGWQLVEDLAGNSMVTVSGSATNITNSSGDPNLSVVATFFAGALNEHEVNNFQYVAAAGTNNAWNFDFSSFNAASVSASDPQGTNWTFARTGLDEVNLTDGEIIGFVNVASHPPAPVLPETPLPEPAAEILIPAIGTLLLLRRPTGTM